MAFWGDFLIKNRELHKFTLQIVSKICNVIIKLLSKKTSMESTLGASVIARAAGSWGFWVFRTLKVVKAQAIMGVLGGLGVIGSAESKLRIENSAISHWLFGFPNYYPCQGASINNG
ncbi:MAG: hypothetical protein E7141_07280 [Rikenellaceae bacterium]|nr:hypothetical protein [Rikenellaceae bacterium]